MSRHLVHLTIVVDDEILDEHLLENEGRVPPYVKDLGEWNFGDLVRAVDLEIVDTGDTDWSYIGEVKP